LLAVDQNAILAIFGGAVGSDRRRSVGPRWCADRATIIGFVTRGKRGRISDVLKAAVEE